MPKVCLKKAKSLEQVMREAMENPFGTVKLGDRFKTDYVEHWRDDCISHCTAIVHCIGSYIQSCEPYSTRFNPRKGEYRNTYGTMVYINHDCWEFRECFLGESVTATGNKPPYIKEVL